MAKKIFWIETISSHRIIYAVEAEKKPSNEDILDRVNSGTLNDIHQEWKGELISSITELTPKEYLEKIKKELGGSEIANWDDKSKLAQIISLDEEVILN